MLGQFEKEATNDHGSQDLLHEKRLNIISCQRYTSWNHNEIPFVSMKSKVKMPVTPNLGKRVGQLKCLDVVYGK